MTKLDPIIAVKSVELSSKWYQIIFDVKSKHGGKEFDVLKYEDDSVMLCLHKWGEHEHPTMMNISDKPGNGLILYFRTDKIDEIYSNAKRIGHPISSEMKTNPNSLHQEFSIVDLDGYYLTISEYHEYQG
jgi:hypothetical protein